MGNTLLSARSKIILSEAGLSRGDCPQCAGCATKSAPMRVPAQSWASRTEQDGVLREADNMALDQS